MLCACALFSVCYFIHFFLIFNKLIQNKIKQKARTKIKSKYIDIELFPEIENLKISTPYVTGKIYDKG
jgi:hypothetical protein